jgi:hypothetical protein
VTTSWPVSLYSPYSTHLKEKEKKCFLFEIGVGSLMRRNYFLKTYRSNV